MKFLILPLLAATSYVDYNKIDWEYGSEVIFNVTYNLEVDISSVSNKKSINLTGANGTFSLKCRFGVGDSLLCHFENATVNYPDNTLDEIPFAIKFNESGIEKLIVSSSIDSDALNMIKNIVKELHVGLDVMRKPEGTYRQLENCIYGVCMTDFNLKLTTVKDMMGKNMSAKGKKHRTWYPGMSIMIDKKRDLRNCNLMAPWISEDIDKDRIQEDIRHYSEYNFPVHVIKFFESTVIADHSKFFSQTYTYARTYSYSPSDKTEFMDIHEKVIVVYDSVVPAKKSYREIKDPFSVQIIAGKPWSSANMHIGY